MALPTRTTPVERCLKEAAFTIGALRRYPVLFKLEAERSARLESAAVQLASASSALAAAQSTYREAVLALVPLRVEVKLVDLLSADVVRSVHRAAQDAGPDVAQASFPAGVSPIIKPFGSSEVEGLRKVEDRIAAVNGWAERDVQLQRVADVRTTYESALEARKNGMLNAGAKRALRDAAKEDFLDVFAAVKAAIAGEFPRDKARQRVFFDAAPRGRKTDDVDDVDDETIEDDGDDSSEA
jgi:hypothetical protein